MAENLAEKQLVSSQPQGTTPMQAVGGNRNANNCPIGADGKRDWSYGLFKCFGRCGLFCWSVWCPCVVHSKNKQRLQHLQTQGTPLPGGGEAFSTNCCLYSVIDSITGAGWVMQINERAQVRERYGIRGDTNGDCFALWCCDPCALTQERREIELEENSFDGK